MYAGYPCRFCQRQRVMEEGDRHVCEKCRRDQATGEFVAEPDPLDEIIVGVRTYMDGDQIVVREVTAREFYQPGPVNVTPPPVDE